MVDAPDESLGEAFWNVAARLRHGTKAALSPLDVVPSQARALGTLLRDGPLRLRELSDRLHIAARSTTEVVDALEERHWVRRTPDPQDRRATLVKVTPAGKKIGQRIRDARRADLQRFFDRLGPDDREQLGRILRRLLEEADAVEGEQDGRAARSRPAR